MIFTIRINKTNHASLGNKIEGVIFTIRINKTNHASLGNILDDKSNIHSNENGKKNRNGET